MVGGVNQQNAGAVAIEAHAFENRCQMRVSRSVPVGHANDLQTLYIDFLIVQHSHSSRRNRTQIFAVISKLLVISSDKTNAEWRSQFVQRLGCKAGIDGRAVK